MAQIGIYMILFGAGSFLLNMAGREFVLLMWIDMWGPATGNLIRGGFVLGGLALLGAGVFLGQKDESQSSQ